MHQGSGQLSQVGTDWGHNTTLYLARRPKKACIAKTYRNLLLTP